MRSHIAEGSSRVAERAAHTLFTRAHFDLIDNVSAPGESELHRILFEWNNTVTDFPSDKCLHEIFEEQVARTPQATALVFEGASLTYLELNRQSNRLAHYLRSLGVKPDVRVAICLERSLEMVVTLLAVLKAGGAYVPLDPGYPVERLAYMLEDSGPVALITQGQLAGLLTGVNPALPVIDLASAVSVWQNQPETNLPVAGVDLLPTHLAYVIYTSGSTGKPKGVMVEHRSLVNRLVWMQSAYGLTASDAVLQKTPFSFDVSVWEFFWPLMVGAKLVMAQPNGHHDPAYLVHAIDQNKITTLHFVPSMLQVFLEQPDLAKCSSLVRVFSSGEGLPPSLARRFYARLPDAVLYNLYGPTETTVDVTAWTCKPDSTLTTVPIGKPIANTRAYILDEGGEPVPVGVAGELFIGGVGVARGYLNRPELTVERFLDDPFAAEAGARMYRSGDICRWLPDGNIEHLGRNDFQVKIRGFRIELGEIETRLADHPEVREAVVTACEDTPGDKRLVAYIVSTAAGKLRDQDLRDLLERQLPDHMVPASFVFLESMPVTANGKLNRSALPPPGANNGHRHQDSSPTQKKLEQAQRRNGIVPHIYASQDRVYVPPSDPLEAALIDIWEEILGITRIGVQDDFFELGGHSLLVARMFQRISEKLGKSVPFATIARAATIEKLADVIRAEAWNSHWSVLVPIKEHGSKPPLFLVHGLRGNVLNFYGFRQYMPADQPIYGLQAYGLNSGRAGFVSIPAMAQHYIKEIRSVQPAGPYFLGGFSAGGLVAYEMAAQLAQSGERVQFLALFDAYIETAGGYWLKSFYSRHAFRMAMLALRVNLHNVRKDGLSKVFKAKLRNLAVNIRITLWLMGRAFVRENATKQVQPHFLTPHEAFTRAVRAYVPQPYSGSAVLFRNPAFDFESHDASTGWARYVTGKLEYKQIAGGHDDIFREPHIASLADQLTQAIEAASLQAS